MDERITMPFRGNELISKIVHVTITDILVPDLPLHDIETAPGVFTSSDFCLVYSDCQRLYLHTGDWTYCGMDRFYLDVDDEYILRTYPGGPSLPWKSIFSIFLQSSITVSTIEVLLGSYITDDNNREGCIDGLIIYTTGEQTICFTPADFPTLVDLIYYKEQIAELRSRYTNSSITIS